MPIAVNFKAADIKFNTEKRYGKIWLCNMNMILIWLRFAYILYRSENVLDLEMFYFYRYT